LVESTEPKSGFGSSEGLSEADARTLLSWVAANNTLLVCSRSNGEIARALDLVVSTRGPKNDDTPHALEGNEAGNFTRSLDSIEVEGHHGLLSARGLPLWEQDDRPAAVLLRWGAGRVVFVADPSFFTARRLHRGADNLIFLGNVAAMYARESRIYFDE